MGVIGIRRDSYGELKGYSCIPGVYSCLGFGVVLGVRATISGTYRFVGSRTKRLIAGLGFWMSVLGL